MKNYFKKFSIIFVMALTIIGIGTIQNGCVANAADEYTDNLIPKMTGYTNGDITVSADAYYTDASHQTHDAWKAFDGSTNDQDKDWYCNANAPQIEGSHWIKVDFSTPKCISKITINCTYSHSSVKNFKFQGSNDNNSWKDIYIGINTRYDGVKSEFPFNNENYYRYYRILVLDSYSSYGKTYCGIDQLEMMEKVSTSFSLNKSTDNLQVGQSDNLVATTIPSGAEVVWTSSDSSIATVDSTGKVIAIKEGTCTITAQIKGSETKATCVVSVTKGGSIEPTEPATGDANLFIELVDGNIKSYNVSSSEISKFKQWYLDRDNTKSNKPYYEFSKGDYKDYVIHDKIDWFEVR